MSPLSTGEETLDTFERDGQTYVSRKTWPEKYKKWQQMKKTPNRQGIVVAFCAGPQTASEVLKRTKFQSKRAMFGGSFRYGIVVDSQCPDETAYVFHIHSLNQGIPHSGFHSRRTTKLFTKVSFSTQRVDSRNFIPGALANATDINTAYIAVDVCDPDGQPLPLGPAVLEQVISRKAAGSTNIGGNMEAGSVGVLLPKFRSDLMEGSSLLDHELEELCSGAPQRRQ